MRAQTAIEFLMTYGWAILVIVVVGIALASLGFFSPGFWGGSKRITGFSDIGVKDFAYYSNKTLELILINRYTSDVNITNAWLIYGGKPYSLNSTDSGTCKYKKLVVGQEQTCYLIFNDTANGLPTSGSISATLTIEAKPLAGLRVPFNVSGTISGPVS